MGFLYLFFSILGESAGKTVDKLNFARHRISTQQMMFVVFLTMTVVLGLYIFTTKQQLPHFTGISVLLLVLIALFSFGGNVFDILSLKADDLSLREPLIDFEPVLAGIVGYLLFPEERKTAFLIAFLLGALIVRWGIHRRKLRSSQKKGMFYLWIAVALYAVVPSLYQLALHYLSPSYIAFFRVASILVLTSMFFRPKKLKALSFGATNYGMISGIFYAIGAVTSLYAIQVYGVVITMLFLMLGPAMRYLAGQFILKEKVRRGEVLSSLMLTLVVAITAFIQ